jgi:hypothetical protein
VTGSGISRSEPAYEAKTPRRKNKLIKSTLEK